MKRSEAKCKSLSRAPLFATPWTIQSMELSRQNTWVDSLSLLQGIFPTQRLNPGLPHCRWILYQLSYQEKSPFNTLNSHNVTHRLYLSKAGGKRIEHILSTSKHVSFHKGTNKNHFEKNTRILKDSFIIPLHQYFSWRAQKIMQVIRNTF